MIDKIRRYEYFSKEKKERYKEERKAERKWLKKYGQEPGKKYEPVKTESSKLERGKLDIKFLIAALRGDKLPRVEGMVERIKPHIRILKKTERRVIKPKDKSLKWNGNAVVKKKGVIKGRIIKFRSGKKVQCQVRRVEKVERVKKLNKRVRLKLGRIRYGELKRKKIRRIELNKIYKKVKESSFVVAEEKRIKNKEYVTPERSSSVKKPKLYKVIFEGERRDKARGIWGIMEGMLMKDGKKRLMENVIGRVRSKLRKKVGIQLNLNHFIERAVGNVTVRVGLGKRRVSGRNRWIPVPILEYKAVREGCKRIKKGMESRLERTIEQRLMNELIDAYNQKGKSVNLVRERKKLIKDSKSWLKLIR